MINLIKKIEKFEKSAKDKSPLEQKIHLQLALQKLSRTYDAWAKHFIVMADLINEGLIRSVLRDDSAATTKAAKYEN